MYADNPRRFSKEGRSVAEVQRARLAGSSGSVWLVVDDGYLPIEPIRCFLVYLEDVERSPNTLRAYAHHLKLFWDYLSWAKLDWTDVGLSDLAGFLAWLRRYESNILPLQQRPARRTESTVNAVLSAVHSFYEFHERLGSIKAFERYRLVLRRGVTSKPFLHHITKGQPVRARLVKARALRRLPRTLEPAQIEALVSACTHMRDKLLLCLLRDTGMRIGRCSACAMPIWSAGTI
jgi:site-specific recombinase XerD